MEAMYFIHLNSLLNLDYHYPDGKKNAKQ